MILRLERKKLDEMAVGFAESIRVQLRAKPLAVEVTDEWIIDLARNMVGGLGGYVDAIEECPWCKTPLSVCCPNGCR